MSSDPYRQLAGGVCCERCGRKMTGDRRAFFRFDATGNRRWCCGATACLEQFFGADSKKGPAYEVVDRVVTSVDGG